MRVNRTRCQFALFMMKLYYIVDQYSWLSTPVFSIRSAKTALDRWLCTDAGLEYITLDL